MPHVLDQQDPVALDFTHYLFDRDLLLFHRLMQSWISYEIATNRHFNFPSKSGREAVSFSFERPWLRRRPSPPSLCVVIPRLATNASYYWTGEYPLTLSTCGVMLDGFHWGSDILWIAICSFRNHQINHHVSCKSKIGFFLARLGPSVWLGSERARTMERSAAREKSNRIFD